MSKQHEEAAASNDSIDLGLEEAWAEHEAAKKARHPNAALKDMLEKGAILSDLLSAMNKIYAVVKYGDQIVIANIVGKKIRFYGRQRFSQDDGKPGYRIS